MAKKMIEKRIPAEITLSLWSIEGTLAEQLIQDLSAELKRVTDLGYSNVRCRVTDDDGNSMLEWSGQRLETDNEMNKRLKTKAKERAKKAAEEEAYEQHEKEEYERLKKKFG